MEDSTLRTICVGVYNAQWEMAFDSDTASIYINGINLKSTDTACINAHDTFANLFELSLWAAVNSLFTQNHDLLSALSRVLKKQSLLSSVISTWAPTRKVCAG